MAPSFSLAPRDIDPGPFHSVGLLGFTIFAIIAVLVGIMFLLGVRCCCCAQAKGKGRKRDVEDRCAPEASAPEMARWYGRSPSPAPSERGVLPVEPTGNPPPPYSTITAPSEVRHPEEPSAVIVARPKADELPPTEAPMSRRRHEVEARVAAHQRHEFEA